MHHQRRLKPLATAAPIWEQLTGGPMPKVIFGATITEILTRLEMEILPPATRDEAVEI